MHYSNPRHYQHYRYQIAWNNRLKAALVILHIFAGLFLMEQALIIPAVLIAITLSGLLFTVALRLVADFIDYLNGYY